MPRYKVFVTKTQEYEIEVNASSHHHAERLAQENVAGRIPDCLNIQVEVWEIEGRKRQAGLTAA